MYDYFCFQIESLSVLFLTLILKQHNDYWLIHFLRYLLFCFTLYSLHTSRSKKKKWYFNKLSGILYSRGFALVACVCSLFDSGNLGGGGLFEICFALCYHRFLVFILSLNHKLNKLITRVRFFVLLVFVSCTRSLARDFLFCK